MAYLGKKFTHSVFGVLIWSFAAAVQSADLVQLDNANWQEFAPRGKEVDAIYGDYVMRSDKLVAVIAQAISTRHANLTVRNVGGAVIDLTLRDHLNDQLSAFYPHGGEAEFSGPIDWVEAFGTEDSSTVADSDAVARLAFRASPPGNRSDDGLAPPEIVVGYELEDGADFLTVVSKVANDSESPLRIRLRDGVRADGEFRFGSDGSVDMWWAADDFWGQAYGIQSVGSVFRAVSDGSGRRRGPRMVRYIRADRSRVEIPAKSSLKLRRRIFPAKNTFDLHSTARRLRNLPVHPLSLIVSDSAGAVVGAGIELLIAKDGNTYARGRTDRDGRLQAYLPEGEYELRVQAPGRNQTQRPLEIGPGQSALHINLPLPGYVEANIVDESGRPLPCKVSFSAERGGDDPDFGPDSAIRGVRNLQYSPDGRFRVELVPGRYRVVVSRGPEFDAILKTIEVEQGQTYRLEETLVRSVDTTGWLSADFHSHSSPSGDNTASQRGRVLNLMAEHIEFAPCTEHNRISTYSPHLRALNAVDRMATCTGIELTGQPLPLNHQNAFPLVHRAHLQDGGAPTTHIDPAMQIERLAMWDDDSEKLLQINHPNIVQMLGDRDQNGEPDGGFERMFHFVDVMEIHPPGSIFQSPDTTNDPQDDFGNRMFNWLQLLNLGYRVPGVVNTDAHWNFHGSGWLRNYIRSATDDPSQATIEELVRESELGHIVMTNGPFLEVEARALNPSGQRAIPGDNLFAEGGKLALHVRVQCSNWLEVNRVQLFINGRQLEKYNFTRRRNSSMFAAGPVVFDQILPITLSEDAHIVVSVAGEGGQLGVVYGLEQGAETQPGSDMPVAVANPIFVDIDGDLFKPNGDMLGRPLPVGPEHRPSHGHDHENFRDRSR